MHMQSFRISVQGASHIKKNKECQDSSECFYDENCAVAIVCDGHGGDDYVRSAHGSAFACAAAKDNILEFIRNADKEELARHPEQNIKNLAGSIINAWNKAVYAHFTANPFTESEIAVLSERAKRKYLQENRIESAYGTTLIAVASTKDYWFGIHIGDGKCVMVDRQGEFSQPIPWDEKCFLNSTTSICDSDARDRTRIFFSNELPAAVFVGSDGIDDCFNTDQQLNQFYRTMLYSFSTSEFDAAVADLSDYLPRLSAKGSGDDVSVAAILDLDTIGEIDSVKEFDREKEKARIEENARAAAQKAEEERQRIEAEQAELKKKKAEEEQKRAEAEARRKQEEERKRAEAELRKQQEKERKRAEAELRQRQEEDRKRVEAAFRKKKEEEHKRLEAELQKRQAEEIKQMEAELQKKEEERRQMEAELQRQQEERDQPNAVSSAFSVISEAASSAFNAASEGLSNLYNAISDKAASMFNPQKSDEPDAASNKTDGVYSVPEPVDHAKDTKTDGN